MENPKTKKEEKCSCNDGIIVCPGCNGTKDKYICAGCLGHGVRTCGKCGGTGVKKQKRE